MFPTTDPVLQGAILDCPVGTLGERLGAVSSLLRELDRHRLPSRLRWPRGEGPALLYALALNGIVQKVIRGVLSPNHVCRGVLSVFTKRWRFDHLREFHEFPDGRRIAMHSGRSPNDLVQEIADEVRPFERYWSREDAARMGPVQMHSAVVSRCLPPSVAAYWSLTHRPESFADGVSGWTEWLLENGGHAIDRPADPPAPRPVPENATMRRLDAVAARPGIRRVEPEREPVIVSWTHGEVVLRMVAALGACRRRAQFLGYRRWVRIEPEQDPQDWYWQTPLPELDDLQHIERTLELAPSSSEVWLATVGRRELPAARQRRIDQARSRGVRVVAFVPRVDPNVLIKLMETTPSRKLAGRLDPMDPVLASRFDAAHPIPDRNLKVWV